MTGHDDRPTTATATRPVRMIDIADSLGVSRATVSLAMRDSPLIAGATRDAVLAEADRLGYVYHRGAANLRSQRNDVIALVIPSVVNPFVSEVSLGAQEVLAEHGFFVAMVNTAERLAGQTHIIRSLIEQRVAGMIIIPVLGTGTDDLAAVQRARIPTVLLTRDVRGAGLPFVAPDEGAIGRLGARHLVVDHGCGSIGYLGGSAEAGPRIARERAVRRAVKDRAVIDEEWSVAFDATLEQAHHTTDRLLRAGPPPPGLLCHSDTVAHGVLRALHDHGIGPERCRVVAIDDLASSASSIPRLSSVAVHPMAQGTTSARILLDALGDRPGHPTPAPPDPVLRARESCGCGS